jgi:hypothetical protein
MQTRLCQIFVTLQGGSPGPAVTKLGGWQAPFERVVIDLSNIQDSKKFQQHIFATLEGGYHPPNNKKFSEFSTGEFHPLKGRS